MPQEDTIMKGKLNFVPGFVIAAAIFVGTAALAAEGNAAASTTTIVTVNYGSPTPTPKATAKPKPSAEPSPKATPKPTSKPEATPSATPSPSPKPTPKPKAVIPAAHDVKFAPLKNGDVVKTAHTDKAKISIGGKYKITKDMLEVEAQRNRLKINFCDIPYGAPLPKWDKAWNSFPAVEVKDPETVRYMDGNTDRLNVYDAYEVERMVRSIYAYAKEIPYLWKDSARTVPNFKVVSEFPEDYGRGWFFPWREGMSAEGRVKSLGAGGTIYVYAADTYYNGKFKDIEYWCWN
jgi:hypothetical protein